MTTWVRRVPQGGLDRLTLLWHVEGSPNTRIQSFRGVCGENLGDAVDQRAAGDDPDAGDRCPVCQGIHARGEA